MNVLEIILLNKIPECFEIQLEEFTFLKFFILILYTNLLPFLERMKMWDDKEKIKNRVSDPSHFNRRIRIHLKMHYNFKCQMGKFINNA